MRKNIVSALIILIAGLSFSCKKTDPPYLIPIITSLSSTNLIAGSTFIINGENLGTDVSQVVATLFDVSGRNSEKLVITSVSNTSITVTIPNKPFTFGTRVYTLQIEIGNSIPQNGANRFQLTIDYPEPASKWFYVSNFFEGYGERSVFKSINFATDSIGYVVLGADLYSTKDGGRTWEIWEGMGGNSSFPGYNPLYVFDKNNFWFHDGIYMLVSNDGKTLSMHKIIPPSGSLTFVGSFMSSSNKGQIAGYDGILYYINGSFLPDALIIEHKSKYYLPDTGDVPVYWQKMSNVDEFNLMLAGSAKIGGIEKPIISHKKAGVFTEYDISDITNSTRIKALQLANPNTAFLVDANNDLFKLTGGTTWIKLSQKATTIYFKDVNIGYASYDGKILKTTDGGLSWKNEFNLEKGETICTITEKNGKLWALGSNKGSGVILKYNP